MSRKVFIIFFCVAAASLTLAQDATPTVESVTSSSPAIAGNSTDTSSGSTQNSGAGGASKGTASSAPPTGSQDMPATGGSSDQTNLNVTNNDSSSQQQSNTTEESSSQSESTTESSPSTPASSGEESTAAEAGSQSSTPASTDSSSVISETQQTNATNSESSEGPSDQANGTQAPTNNNSNATETAVPAIAGGNDQPGNREGDQQTQGSSNQVGAQGRALDGYGTGNAASSQRSTTVRRNNVPPVSANNNRISSSLTSNPNVAPGNYGPIQTNAQWSPITEMNVQSPNVWEALGLLRGNNHGRNVQDPLNSVQMYDLISTAQAGADYPNYSDIPTTGFSCEQVGQPGFYADTEARCQVIRRCDVNAIQYSYLCPNMTVFNQITLVCDWFFNVDCTQSRGFYDYSNRRLYHGSDWVLLSDEVQNRLTVNTATTIDPLLEI